MRRVASVAPSVTGGIRRRPAWKPWIPPEGTLVYRRGKTCHGCCGHCHSDAQFMKRYNPALPVDQVAEYSTSAHGRLLKESNNPKVATCASCHPAHAMRPASDPASSVHPLRVAELCGRCHADAAYMQPYGIPTDQLQQYRESVHWRTLSVQ